MRIAVDTNAYTAAARGEDAAVAVLRKAAEVWMPFAVLAELRAGFRCGSIGRQNEAQLVRFLNSPRVRIAWPDESTTRIYAQLFADLKLRATPIPTNDLWIASVVLQHDLILFTRDEHFSRLPQLARI